MVFHANKISSYRFFWELKDHLSGFSKYVSFVITKERSFYKFPAFKKISFYSQKSIISTFPLSKKFIIWTFPFVQSLCFRFFYYKKKWEAELRSFFLSQFLMATAWYMPNLVALEIPWNRIWDFNFAETKTKASVY